MLFEERYAVEGNVSLSNLKWEDPTIFQIEAGWYFNQAEP